MLVAPIVLVQTQGKNDKNVIVLIRFGAVELAAPIKYNLVCTTWIVNLQKLMVLLTQKRRSVANS